MFRSTNGARYRIDGQQLFFPNANDPNALGTTEPLRISFYKTVSTFVRAFAEAVAYTSTHHDETAPLMAEFTGIPVGVIGRMARATSAPAVTPALLQPVIDASAKFGAIKRSFSAQELIDVNAR